MRKVLVALFIALLALVPAMGAAAGGPPQDLQGRALGLFDIDGVVFTDINEGNGHLVVGVTNQGLARSVEARASALGISVSQMDVIETQPIVFATSLRDKIRPIEGGLQIAFQVKTATYACTLGFNAVSGATSGFVTASHCTAKQGVVEGTRHYQPTIATANLIGTETADPAYVSCAPGKKCRYSDAAFSTLASGVTASLGALARTTGANNGSLAIDGSFAIVGEQVGNAAVGTTLNKVGRTTGWTHGAVIYSGVNVAVTGTRFILLGQDIVAAGVGGGDSGSPVFTSPDASGNVVLAGILWGGSTDGSSFVYSPISNVESELGELVTPY